MTSTPPRSTAQWTGRGTGLGVSPGRAAGRVVLMPDPIEEPPRGARASFGADLAVESERVTTAATAVAADLAELAEQVDGKAQEVIAATAAMATDPSLVEGAQAKVAQGAAPERAIWDTAAEIAALLEAAGGLTAERVADLEDVRNRVVARLQGRPVPGVPAERTPFVLVAVDLSPAETASLDPRTCQALVTAEGGPTSHTAILVRELGIPAVVALAGAQDLAAGETVLVDGAAGTVLRDPDEESLARVRSIPRSPRTFTGAAGTADGVAVELLANVGDGRSARAAAAAGARGVGLFRTEFCFLGRDRAPGVPEQVRAYREVLRAFPDGKVVVRTLDAGADKPLPFVTARDEGNPALGVRGLRTSRRHPEVLEDQLAAIAEAAAAESAEVWVMAPMVAVPAEAEHFAARAGAHGLTAVGVMIEVPAAALMADAVLAPCSFASIGTNDLTQYAMAADRLLSGVATLNDPWQPAALALIAATCAAGGRTGRPIGVCGEAAADPALACVLVGLGVRSLSMTPRALADVAAVVGEVDLPTCERLAQIAVHAISAADGRADVRAALAEQSSVLEDLGL